MREAEAANDCIIEILESYMKFVNITERTIKCFAKMPAKYETLLNMLITKVKNNWTPVLEDAKKIKKAQETGKN